MAGVSFGDMVLVLEKYGTTDFDIMSIFRRGTV